MTQPNLPTQTVADDEIDLMQLISNIWRTKWRVIIAMVLVAAAFVSLQAYRFLNAVPTQQYSQVFDFNFAGLKNGTFPDGSPFVLTDIVSPTVLSRVYQFSDLDQYGVSQADFSRAITIEPFSPDYFLILNRYKQLSGGNRTAAELSALQEQMQTELRRAQSNSIRLNLQFNSGVMVPAAIAEKVLQDIATVWAELAIEERGVLQLNMPIYSERIFDEQRFEALDYLLGIELLIENIGLVNQNVATLKQQPNAAGVRDEESGLNLEDLSKAIRDVQEYDLRQLIDPVRELGLTRNADTVKLYYNRQLRDLALERDNFVERARITRDALQRYSADQGSVGPDSTTGTGSTLSSPQLGDAFLDRLVEISRQGGAEEFRQELLREVLRLENRALDLSKRMAEINITLNALEDNNIAGASSELVQLRRVYANEVAENLPQVLQQLREYTQVVGRIHGQLGRQASGSVSRLIQVQGGSFQSASNQIVARKDILAFIALMVLTLFVAMFSALIYDAMQRRKS